MPTTLLSESRKHHVRITLYAHIQDKQGTQITILVQAVQADRPFESAVRASERKMAALPTEDYKHPVALPATRKGAQRAAYG